MNTYIPHQKSLERVVIVGGGFGGIQLAKSLLKNKNFQVVLVDKQNYHTFQPLLYQVATGGLEPYSIAYSIRHIFRKKENFYFRMAEVQNIDTDADSIHTNIGDIEYDHLVIATGATTNLFNFENIKRQLFTLKTVPEALNMRSFFIQNFEKALLTDSTAEKESLMNVVIVGGGPTGVELAGALGEMKKYVLPHDYPELDLRRMNIYLFERQPRVLSNMSEKSSKATQKYLEQLGVNVFTSTSVNSYDGDTVIYGDESTLILADTLIWTAGIKGNVIDGIDKNKILRGDRIKTDVFNKVDGYDNVYAIGDIAAMITEDTPRGHPQVAPVAMQQAKNLAKNFIATSKGKTLKPFKYKDQGAMATIGRNRAVVDLDNWKFHGIFAWFVWLFVHLLSLVGFRNKVSVLMDWVYNYFTYDRAMRLVIRPYFRKK
jgi:NADH dehydrogenase